MQNKISQFSNSKIKKEAKINPKNELSKINPLQTNQNEMTKQKSKELYNQNSPKNTLNTSNPTSSNNSNKNYILDNNMKQANYSGMKTKITKKSCISNTQLKQIKKFDDVQNSDEKERTFDRCFSTKVIYNITCY